MTTVKRFYQQATVAPEGGKFRILLDGRPVRTPAKAILELPSRKAAEAVAAEWQAQGEKVNPLSMPFTRLANTAIDRLGAGRDLVVDEICRYGASDLLCYRAEGPDKLVARQRAAWDRLLEWLYESHGIRLKVTTGIVFIDQDGDDVARLCRIVEGFDDFTLVGLHYVTTLAGSCVIGLAVAAGRLKAPEAAAISSIDEIFQAEFWGEDAEILERLGSKAQELAEAAEFIGFFRG
jgi:chaperone required for assembly of F1-ATPase